MQTTNLAARLDAACIPAVTEADSLEHFKGKIAEEPGLIKVAFIDCWAPDFSATPEEDIINMISAAKIVVDRCVHHNHANSHCKLEHFHLFASLSKYVARGLPNDLDQSNNQTAWFKELSSRITEMANMKTNSSAMSLSNAVHHPRLKDRHCWTNWAEYVEDDDQSRKLCRTLTRKAKGMMEVAVCKHIQKFTSFGRRLVG